jgi:hypothetical protein
MLTLHCTLPQGPPTLFDTESVAHKQWAATGQTIQRSHTKLQEQGLGGLKGILIISAHWESESDIIKSEPGMLLPLVRVRPLTNSYPPPVLGRLSQHDAVAAHLRLLRLPAGLLHPGLSARDARPGWHRRGWPGA